MLVSLLSDMGCIAVALTCFAMAASAIGESLICSKAIDGMTRNPEMYSKLRTGMIVACALDETTAIYSLLVAILLIFMA